MCPIDLHDTLHCTFNQPGIRVRCPLPGMPKDEENLAGRAARHFYDALDSIGNPKPPSVEIQIEKRIPVAGGLGGGSGNAAAVLMALNETYGFVFSLTQLMDIGARIGADVPFFILGEPALGLGIGTDLRPFPLKKRYGVLLVNPGFDVSTAGVYRDFKLGLTKCEEKLRDFFFESPQDGRFDPVLHLCNDLETVTEQMHPEIAEIKSLLMRAGALGSLMSGSGPTVFGLFKNRRSAETAEKEWIRPRASKRGWRVIVSETLS